MKKPLLDRLATNAVFSITIDGETHTGTPAEIKALLRQTIKGEDAEFCFALEDLTMFVRKYNEQCPYEVIEQSLRTLLAYDPNVTLEDVLRSL